MAIIRWISTNGNGSSTASWEGGAVPTATDRALFDGTSQVSWTSGLTATAGATIQTTRKYTGNIGTASSYLTLTGVSGAGSVTTQAAFEHTGMLYVTMDNGASGNASLSRMIINMPKADAGRAHVKGQFATLYIKGGGVTLDATLALSDSVYVFGPDANVSITSGCTMTNDPQQWAGYVECDITDAPIIYGGVWVQKKALATGLDMYGGSLDYRPVPFSAPDIALNLWAGALDTNSDAGDPFSGVSTAAVYIGPDFRLGGVESINPGTSTTLDLRKPIPQARV